MPNQVTPKKRRVRWVYGRVKLGLMTLMCLGPYDPGDQLTIKDLDRIDALIDSYLSNGSLTSEFVEQHTAKRIRNG